jgi:hypothetical protein
LSKGILINLISGPGVGKSTTAAQLFAALKMKKQQAELVQENAKQLVWTKNFETLNNQYQVSHDQYKVFKSIVDEVDFTVTDGSLIHGLAYNITNQNNISNIDKTKEAILTWFSQFNNFNIFIERRKCSTYDTIGRIESFEEAKIVDNILLKELDENNIPYLIINIDDIDIESIAEQLINYKKQL